MMTGPTIRDPLTSAPASITTRPITFARIVYRAVHLRFDALKHHPVDFEHVGYVPGVLPVSR